MGVEMNTTIPIVCERLPNCFICRVILYITVKVKTYILLLYTSLEILRLLKQKCNTQDCAQFLTIFRAKMLNTYSWASRKCEKKPIGVYRDICHLCFFINEQLKTYSLYQKYMWPYYRKLPNVSIYLSHTSYLANYTVRVVVSGGFF